MRKTGLKLLRIMGYLLGFSVLLYPTVSNYLQEKNATTIVSSYEQILQDIQPEEERQILEQAAAYNASLTALNAIEDPFSNGTQTEDEAYLNALDLDGNGMMGYLKIPKIRVTLPIYHGTEERVLQSGVGHVGNTSLPVGGDSTHSVLTGHRGLPSAELFTDLDQLEVGDVFFVKVMHETLAYEVDQIKVVEPDNISDIFIEDGKDYVTLVTCTPYGINSHRLLIRGTRIPYDEKYAEKVPLKPAPAVSDRPAEEQGRKLGTRQWILFAIAAFGVAILLGILAPSGKKKGKASSKTEETADQRNKELSQNSKAEKKEGSHEKNEEEK